MWALALASTWHPLGSGQLWPLSDPRYKVQLVATAHKAKAVVRQCPSTHTTRNEGGDWDPCLP